MVLLVIVKIKTLVTVAYHLLCDPIEHFLNKENTMLNFSPNSIASASTLWGVGMSIYSS